MKREFQGHSSWLCYLGEDTETRECQVLNLQKGEVPGCKVFLRFKQDTECEMLHLDLVQIVL